MKFREKIDANRDQIKKGFYNSPWVFFGALGVFGVAFLLKLFEVF